MISITDVSMFFPVARPIQEALLHPLRKTRRMAALTDVSLEFPRGARVALLGPNGAGKTTLLKLIGGLLLPSEGEVLVNGLSTARHNTAARRTVGLVMNEERSFFWRLTGLQNLRFFGALDNLSGKQLEQRLEELVELVGLESFVNKPFSTYSSGMKQRLAMARGLLADPEVLILDEPTRTLDPIACDELIELILNRIHADLNRTLLIATHRFEETSRLCDRTLVIDGGRILSCDDLDDLARREIDLPVYYRECLARGERDDGNV
jgi:ABC-2 type transport system ATP-binding protein